MHESYNENCLFYCLEQLLNINEYGMSYLAAWRFGYSQGGASIGENLENGYIDEFELARLLLLKFHGIRLNQCDNDYLKHYDSSVGKKKELAVLLRVDSFECYWLPFYQKHHEKHIMILTERENQEYLILDNYGYRKLLYDFFEENIVDIYSLEKTGCIVNISSYNICSELYNCSITYNPLGNCNELRKFVDDIRNDFNIDNEINKRDVTSSKLVKHLMYLSEARRNVRRAVEYIQGYCTINLENVIYALDDLVKLYEKLRVEILKIRFIGKKNDKIENILKQIYVNESYVEDYFFEMRHFIDNKSI